MLARRAGIFVFPAYSYEEAHEIIGRLLSAGFPRAAMSAEQSGRDHQVALHTNEDNRRRAERAVYGHGYLGKLALAGTLFALGGTLWSLWNRSRADVYRTSEAGRRGSGLRVPSDVTETGMTSTSLADTGPLGSHRLASPRDRQATEAGAMPIS
jgi:hypothetical protein